MEKDKMLANGQDGWKLGLVLVLAVALVVAAALAVRSWAKRTYLQPMGQPATWSIK
ncbi:MAG: hypothetical protein M1376_16975 [Planctomycetes bacterium]|nr:hypothetical protein [Planctomycetota bacterium]